VAPRERVKEGQALKERERSNEGLGIPASTRIHLQLLRLYSDKKHPVNI